MHKSISKVSLYSMAVMILIPTLIFTQVEDWIYTYNGTGNDRDEAYSVIRGNDGNIYTCGYSIDSLSGWDFTVISVDSTGTERWVYTYDNSGKQDVAYDVVYGADGNIYASGYCSGSVDSLNFTVVSLTPGGTERWVYTYNGPGNHIDILHSITYGADGNIYVAGRSVGNIEFDFTVISLASTGSERWVYRHDGTGQTDDRAYDVIYGSDNNIYACGYSYDSVTHRDLAVISLTTSGTERWVYTYNGPASDKDGAFAIVYGNDGYLYTTGWSVGNGTSYDYTIISLTTSGVERYIYRYNGAGDEWDMGRSIAYGPNGNIYTCGWQSASLLDDKFTVISVTDSCTERWNWIYDNPNSSYASELTIGANNNIYSIGRGWSGTSCDIFVTNHDTLGNLTWKYEYNGIGNGWDDGFGIHYGNNDKLYLAGLSTGNGSSYDITVICLDIMSSTAEHKNTNELSSQLIIHPNPVHSIGYLDYKLENNADINISIIDISGRVVKKLFSCHQKKGSYKVKIDFESLASGVYYVKLQHNEYTNVEQIVFIK